MEGASQDDHVTKDYDNLKWYTIAWNQKRLRAILGLEWA
jgi:hypothetical protein